jgi:hypothetical protein
MAMPTFGAGQRLYAEDLNTIARQIDSLTNPGWITFTPTWTGASGNPAIGNGTLTGRYRQSATSDLVIAEYEVVYGSTTTNGTGQYTWTLPVTASSAAVTFGATGAGSLLDNGSIRYPITCTIVSTTQVRAYAPPYANASTTINSRGGDLTSTSPITWNTGDTIVFTIQYDAA